MAKLTQEETINKLSENKLGEDNQFENYSIEDLIHESNNTDIKDNKKAVIVEDNLDSKEIELIKNKGVKNKIEFVEINNDCPVIDFLDEIENEKLKSKTISNIYILADLRNKARPPLSTYIDDGIYELRTKFSTNITRIFYFFIWGDKIIMTNGYIKKSQKIDKKEFVKAKKLMNVYLNSKANLKESNDIVSTISLDDYLKQCLINEEFRYYRELEFSENKDDLEEDLIHESNTIDNKDNGQNKNVINETADKLKGGKDVGTITMSRSNALSMFGENDLIDDAHWFKQHYGCDFDLNDHELVITGSLEDLKRIIKDYHLDDIYYILDEDTKKVKTSK